jgi:hypothetical protein
MAINFIFTNPLTGISLFLTCICGVFDLLREDTLDTLGIGDREMTTETTTETLDPTEYEVLIADANEVGVEFAKRDKADRGRFKRDIKPDGFGVRLAQIQIAARAALKVERLPSATLKQLGLDKVSSALRSEWVWFVQNETAAREFIKASKKGFTNVSALKTAMAKAAKAEAKAEASTEGESESETTEGEASENATTEGESVPITVETIAIAIDLVAKRDGKTVEDVMSEVVDLFAKSNQPSDLLNLKIAA